MEFIKKLCAKCGKERKFVKDTDRDRYAICGECWNWQDY